MKNFKVDENNVDHRYPYRMIVSKINNLYYCQFYFSSPGLYVAEFYGNKSQTTEFLKHVLYNNYVII